jgi:hypothetical protein
MAQRESQQYWQKLQSGHGFFLGVFFSMEIVYNLSQEWSMLIVVKKQETLLIDDCRPDCQ